MFINKTFQIETVFRELKWWSLCLKHPVGSSYSLITIYNQDSPIDEILSQIAEWLLCVPATIFFPRYDTYLDTVVTVRYKIRYITHNNKTPRVLLVGSEVCTADKPSWKHACVCCVHHLEYNAKHCSAWIFLVSLFGKSLCIRTKNRKEGEH